MHRQHRRWAALIALQQGLRVKKHHQCLDRVAGVNAVITVVHRRSACEGVDREVLGLLLHVWEAVVESRLGHLGSSDHRHLLFAGKNAANVAHDVGADGRLPSLPYRETDGWGSDDNTSVHQTARVMGVDDAL